MLIFIKKKMFVVMILLYIIVYKNNIFVVAMADSYDTYKKAYLIIFASTKSVFLISVIYVIGHRCILELVKNDFNNGLHFKNENKICGIYIKNRFLY